MIENENQSEDPLAPRFTVSTLAEVISSASEVRVARDDNTYSTYERVPVSDFGTTMLKNMGWVEGTAIGKSASENGLVKPIEYIPR